MCPVEHMTDIIKQATVPLREGATVALYHPKTQRFLYMSEPPYFFLRRSTSKFDDPGNSNFLMMAQSFYFTVVDVGNNRVALLGKMYNRFVRVGVFGPARGGTEYFQRHAISATECLLPVRHGSGYAFYNELTGRVICCPMTMMMSRRPILAVCEKVNLNDFHKFGLRAEFVLIPPKNFWPTQEPTTGKEIRAFTPGQTENTHESVMQDESNPQGKRDPDSEKAYEEKRVNPDISEWYVSTPTPNHPILPSASYVFILLIFLTYVHTICKRFEPFESVKDQIDFYDLLNDGLLSGQGTFELGFSGLDNLSKFINLF